MILPKQFRKGTVDLTVWKRIQSGDEYGEINFSKLRTVVDVGAHIGSFSFLAATSGVEQVLAFEPNPESHALAEANLAGLENVQLHNAGVLDRSGIVKSVPHANPLNTGGATVVWTARTGVRCFSIDEVVDMLGEIDLLKLDCEGSEFAILRGCTKLDAVRGIVGEYHGEPRQIISLCRYLGNLGYVTRFYSTHPKMGKFYASRP